MLSGNEKRKGCLTMKEAYYLKVEDACVGYENKIVLENVNFSVKVGEIFTLIGQNGSGKTTLLKSLVRQLKLKGGVIVLGEESLLTFSEKELAKKMAVVLTEPIRTELATVKDVVATGRYPYTGRFGILREKDWRLVEEAMELSNVTELAKLDFQQLSDGQKQRVMLARAICQEPEILVLDEPTSYLDLRHKLEFFSVLRKLSKEKQVTVIMSLHEIDMARLVSDTVACVKDGEIVKVGEAKEILDEEFIKWLFDISNELYEQFFL